MRVYIFKGTGKYEGRYAFTQHQQGENLPQPELWQFVEEHIIPNETWIGGMPIGFPEYTPTYPAVTKGIRSHKGYHIDTPIED